ncbi:uncharacterized protein [Littorina saxatilis]|uniref:uncharacterized protein isoform X1 n=1 Tax=Littorina saxatilis TaxID=31220 RepID=UPI0038B510C4
MDARDQLELAAWDEDDAEDDFVVFALLDQPERRAYEGQFALDHFTAIECEDLFRFSAEEIRRLCALLGMQRTMQAPNGMNNQGTKASGLEVLCICLRRLAYPCRFADLSQMFHRPKPELCVLFKVGIDFIYDQFSDKLTNLNQPWLTVPQLERYCAAIHAKGAPLEFCWGMVDGTIRSMCRPGHLQQEVYNGHKRVHSLKFQCVVTPNGLVANVFGPLVGRRHDAALLNGSGILEHMQQHMVTPAGDEMYLYGDGRAYPLTPNLMRPYRGQITEEQQAFNTEMSRVRNSVEWEFSKIVRLWAFLDFKKNLKLFLSPVGKLYLVGVLLSNCHTCLHGSETSQFFGLNPPTLEEYLY